MCYTATVAAGQLRGYGSGLGLDHGITQLAMLLVSLHQLAFSPSRVLVIKSLT